MAIGQLEHKQADAWATEDDRDQYSAGFSDPTGLLVKPKWRGTEQDKSDMDVLGRGQVLRVMRQTSMSYRGWVCMLGWQAGLLSVGFIIGTVTQGLIVLNNPTYTFERWHGTLLVWAMTIFCVTFNTVGAKILPIIQIVISEEVEDAGRTLPKSIMCSVYLNGAMGFIMAITLCFCLGDLAAIVDTPTGYPFIQVFYNATQSYVATNIMVSPTMHVPVRATGVSVAITCLVSLINIGSTTALNAIVALGVVALLSTYYISISCLIWRRLKGAPLPARRWTLDFPK
ncbi:MAG: hypothetical protein Q9185_004527 [Variospora sp. 1 TL-2023]